MPLDCLDGLVNVKGCGSNPTASFIQQLPGISIPDIDVAISNEHVNAKEFLEDQIACATEIVIQDVWEHLALKHELKSFIENDSVGHYFEKRETNAAVTGYLTGIRIRIDKTPYLKLFINRLRLFVDYSGAVNVFVYDLLQNKILDTISVTAVAGEVVTVDVNKEYYTQKQKLNLFIGYASSFASYKANLISGDDCGSCYTNTHISFTGVKILSSGSKIVENVDSNSGTAGLSFTYSLSCSFEEHLCSIRNLLTLPVKYKAGALIMQHLKSSKRPNPLVTAYKGDHEAMEEFYEGQYKKKMNSLLGNMKMPKSICFECNPRAKSMVVLP